MPDVILNQSEYSPEELRFGFETIRMLAENIRGQTAIVAKLQEQSHEILLRLDRIEQNKVDRRVTLLEEKLSRLEHDKAKRDGATGVLSALIKSPALGWFVGALTAVWAVVTRRVHL